MRLYGCYGRAVWFKGVKIHLARCIYLFTFPYMHICVDMDDYLNIRICRDYKRMIWSGYDLTTEQTDRITWYNEIQHNDKI